MSLVISFFFFSWWMIFIAVVATAACRLKFCSYKTALIHTMRWFAYSLALSLSHTHAIWLLHCKFFFSSFVFFFLLLHQSFHDDVVLTNKFGVNLILIGSLNQNKHWLRYFLHKIPSGECISSRKLTILCRSASWNPHS